MAIQPIILPTDALLYLLVLVGIVFAFWAKKREHIRVPWQHVCQNRIAVASMTILGFFLVIALLDSVHFQTALPSIEKNHQVQYGATVHSVLDVLMSPAGTNDEETYSAPFAHHLFSKQTITLPNGKQWRLYPRLEHATNESLGKEVGYAVLLALLKVGLISGLIFVVHYLRQNYFKTQIAPTTQTDLNFQTTNHLNLQNDNPKDKQFLPRPPMMSGNFYSGLEGIVGVGEDAAVGVTDKLEKESVHSTFITFIITFSILLFSVFVCSYLSKHFHIFGTDKVGQDVYFQAIKSIRTGIILGTLTTLVMLPFALLLGPMAGYFGGFIDDVIQYIYTTLSSIPGVLLIAASVLALQIFITNHPKLLDTLAGRADARLLALCFILGITSWTGLCRLLRGESLKLREMDYVQAARALGVSHFKIIIRHILPNVMHIVIISVVLDFSGLVLAEAVLTYVGVGVDPTTNSWGNMINTARLELARDPVVWWPLAAAFVLMFTLVLTANLFADVVRDAFDPRIKDK